MMDDSSAAITPAYKVPKWAGIPPPGHHLDVMKEGKLVQVNGIVPLDFCFSTANNPGFGKQSKMPMLIDLCRKSSMTDKLMIDEKNCYLFGRNMSQTDFCIDHASCSRVHAALVYHKNLQRFFLVDLDSRNIRIENQKPTQLPIDSQFHFGASTRIYVLREKPKNTISDIKTEDETLVSLPDYENEIDHLTEYNTAQNRRISMLGVSENLDIKPATAKKRKSVSFKTDDEVINPEDIDPTVGRFRNLVQTSIIPSGNKRFKMESRSYQSSNESLYSSLFNNPSRIGPLQSSSTSSSPATRFTSQNLLSKNSLLGIHLPNPAPEIDEEKIPEPNVREPSSLYENDDNSDDISGDDTDEGKKKKYAKEAWPGHEKTTSLSNF